MTSAFSVPGASTFSLRSSSPQSWLHEDVTSSVTQSPTVRKTLSFASRARLETLYSPHRGCTGPHEWPPLCWPLQICTLNLKVTSTLQMASIQLLKGYHHLDSNVSKLKSWTSSSPRRYFLTHWKKPSLIQNSNQNSRVFFSPSVLARHLVG